MHTAGFETSIEPNERPQIYAVDRSETWIGK
jgi:hypothetical protein